MVLSLTLRGGDSSPRRVSRISLSWQILDSMSRYLPIEWQTRLAKSMPWAIDDLIKLRPCTGDDAPILVQLYADPDVRRLIGRPLAPTIDETRNVIDTRRDVMSSYYIVERLDAAAAVGCAAFLRNDFINDVDILIALLPQHRRKNYGSQILERMRKAWIDELKNDHCTVTVQPNNDAARKVLAKCGFRQSGEYTNKCAVTSLIYRYPQS